jgi:hypothetical protein
VDGLARARARCRITLKDDVDVHVDTRSASKTSIRSSGMRRPRSPSHSRDGRLV